VHGERLQDVLVDIDLEILARETLDDLTQIDDARIGVGEAAAGLELDLGIGKHRRQLGPASGLERLPVLVAPGPCPPSKAGAVAHQVAKGDRVRIAERVVDLGKLRNVFNDRIVELEQAAVAKLQDRDPGHRLGDRRPVIDGLRVHRDMGVGILLAEMIGGGDAAVANEVEAASGDARAPHLGAVELAKVAQRRLEGALAGQGGSGGEEEEDGGEPMLHWDAPDARCGSRKPSP
jgi:hypothetical protein